MKFLIASEPNDYHALLVKRGLEEMGHLVRLLFIADHPTIQKNVIFVDNESYQWLSTDSRETFSDNEYDVVWWRRVRKPYLPRNLIHPDDYQIALRENNLFYESLTNQIAPDAWWVNSKEGAQRAKSKVSQLKIAVDCGMNIPLTLCANDPKIIRDFVKHHEKQGVIYKPLSTNFWCKEDKAKIAYTSKINQALLSKDALLQFVPGIYQKEIKKRYELRITCFGTHIVAAKLDSQSHSKGKIDWRKIPDGELHIEPEPYILPDDLQTKIGRFMKKMGLVFGALDFIVSENGQYFFLEINEQGQFLWIEDYNSDFKLLDAFINFLINKSANFKWNPQKIQHQMKNYLQDVSKLVAENLQDHVNVNLAGILSEQQ